MATPILVPADRRTRDGFLNVAGPCRVVQCIECSDKVLRDHSTDGIHDFELLLHKVWQGPRKLGMQWSHQIFFFGTTLLSRLPCARPHIGSLASVCWLRDPPRLLPRNSRRCFPLPPFSRPRRALLVVWHLAYQRPTHGQKTSSKGLSGEPNSRRHVTYANF